MGKEQELLAAAKTGDIQQVRKLLSKLRKTVSSSKLEASADVGKDGKFKKNPKKSAKLLNVNAADDNCFTALHHSALLDKADICRELIDVEATVDLKDKNGMTPLHLAAWAGRVEQASLLLRSGADSNSLSSNGETALILTAQYGKTDVASLLLGNKADVGAIAFGGSTALDKACQFGHLEMVELLVKSGALKYVKPLSNADKKDPNKHTPLHLAAKHGHVEIIRALLSYGVDVNLETANGTSLHEAALYGRKDIVKLLVECGVDVNRRNLYQQTSLDIVLHFVKSAAAKEMKEILIESGCANVVLARANFDYHVADSTMLSLCEGQTIAVLEQNANGRWKGSVGEGESKRTGFFPENAVTLLIKRPESLGSVAAIVTNGGLVDPIVPSLSPEAIYDCLKPKMSDMPSPPLPVSFENDEEVHSYGTLGQTPMTGKPKLLIRDQSFTGQYTFEDNVSTGRMKNLVKPYEEVVLPQEQDHKLQAKKGLTYAQMDLPQTNSCVHRTHPKTSYADVAVPLAFGDQQFLVANKEESMPRRSSSVSCSRNRPYENVGIGQRSLSVSKPRPVPPTRISSRKGTPKYENVGLNAQTKDLLRPQPAISRSVEEYEEDYEVMDLALTGRSPTIASSDSEYLTMHPHRQGTQPSQRSQSPSPTTSPQQSPMKPQLNTSVKPPGKKQVSPYEVMVLGTDGTLSFSSNGNNVKCEIEPEVKFSTHTINPPGMSMPTNPLPIIDWLALFNLQQYSEAFVAAGYDDSSYLVEITDKDLIALGIEKPGHRKKLLHLSASTADALHDAFPSTKLTSISDWFKSLGLSVYEQAFLQQGYDDIDFIVDITEDELKEMGVTLQGHIRKLTAAIARLGQTADREEQLVVIPVPEEETRDVVSPLLSSESSARTSPQFPETRSQKVAPPKPRRPPRGWESSLLNRSRVEEEPTNCEQRVFVQPSGVGSHCHTVKEEILKPEPPHRRDSFHRTREQMDKFRNDAVDCEQSEERSDLGNKFPPPPPRRDDSLSVAPSTSGSNEVPSPVIREPPPKPVRVDSIKEDKVEVVRIQRSPVPRTTAETPTAKPTTPKPAVKPRPPPIAKKPGSIKPSSRKPLPPTVAPKPALPTEEREPVSYQNAPRTQSPAPPERLSPGLLAGKPSPPTVAVKPSLPTVPMPVAAHQPTLAEVLADSQDSMPNDLEPPVRSPPLSSKPHGKRPPTLVEVLADSHDLMPNDLEGDLSLEEAIKTALRSPVVQKKHKSPATEFPRSLKHDLSPDEFLYEQDNSDKLMDDIDNMLRDLNKELDDLIPGI